MSNKPSIAIVGAGISGLTCAWLLRQQYDVHLFEANDYLGGHTQTTDVEIDGQLWPVNTGFIVYNDWTYPNFIRLMETLGVATEASDMSFSVSCKQTDMEYNGASLNSLFAKRCNLINPAFLRMVWEILRFNRETRIQLAANAIDGSQTLGQYLQQHNYGDYFRRYYIIPMGAAIWSASETMMMNFPVHFFLQFFNNHGLLSVSERPQWRVISGGSRSYVERIVADLPAGQVHSNSPVTRIERDETGVSLTVNGQQQRFDQLVLACHSDQALSMLANPSQAEQQILAAIPYQDNEVVLHTDVRLLPQRQSAWASWNYHIDPGERETVAVTYHMNRLQNYQQAPQQFCVTLNRSSAIDPQKIIRKFRYAHPVFTLDGMAAQQRHHEISGLNRTHFAGAYWFNGFHEDGVNSALRVCKALGVNF
ncbi:NAD(P)/FAD-dependent oxidoreductase [Oceanobacter mangrovi]|uniref:NAD(P)/FAD-dependent oxidoreductase n=1 Tax=Oceanobacter mangrovi TaxID=2862510 RepID=UPI001C8EBCED|nr:FAD-dependent oxidoreductase [Oceanobacter mangrovi]